MTAERPGAPSEADISPGLVGCLALVAIAFVAFVFVAPRLGGGSRGSRTRHAERPTTRTSEDIPLEVKIAAIDGHINLGREMADEEGRLAVTRVRYLLDELTRKSGEKRERLADQAVAARRELREQFGRTASVQEILEDANKAYPEGGAGTLASSDVMAMIVLIRGRQ